MSFWYTLPGLAGIFTAGVIVGGFIVLKVVAFWDGRVWERQLASEVERDAVLAEGVANQTERAA